MNRPLGLGLAVVAAAPARAHGTLADKADLYAGAMHPFLAFEHLMLLIGFGLLMGRNPRRDLVPLGLLFLGLVSGLVIGGRFGVVWAGTPAVVLLAGLSVGVLLAASLPFSGWVAAAVGAGVGSVVGLDTDIQVPAGSGDVANWMPFAGVVISVFLIVLNSMALAAIAVRPPYSTGLRVAGSWIAAAALLVLALEYRRMWGGA